MKTLSRVSLTRMCANPALAFLAVLALSGCGSGPISTLPPPAPSATAVEPSETREPAAVPEPTEPVEPTKAAEPTAAPDAIDLAVSVARDGDLKPGGQVTYRVLYENLSPREAGDVTLDVTLPEGASLVSSSSDGKSLAPSSASGADLEYALPPLTAGASGEIALALKLPATLTPASTMSLVARIAGPAPDPDGDNNYAEYAEMVAAPDLAVSVRPADGSHAFVPGAAVSYLLVYTNVSRIAAQSVAISGTLSAGMAFTGAFRVQRGKTPVSADIQGDRLALDLGDLPPRGGGEIVVEAALGVALQRSLACTVGIAAAGGELDLADNRAEDVQHVQAEGPDVWVELASQGDDALGGTHAYEVRYGNRGTEPAGDVALSLAIPSMLQGASFSSAPASYADGVATWQVGELKASSRGKPLTIKATIGKVGQAVARATVSTAAADVDPSNDSAEVTDELLSLDMPTITGPSAALVGAQPVFFGRGKPGATVSLYLASSGSQPGRPLGTALVNGSGKWELSPTTSLEQPGWYWFTATQQLGTFVSPITGVANYYASDLTIDTNSLTVNGKRVGGIDQEIDWPENCVLTFGARIVTCDAPLTPTLLVRYYNPHGLVVNRQTIKAKIARPDGYVEFDFRVPSGWRPVEWQIELGFFCREEIQSSVIGRSPGLATGLRDWTDVFHPECWFGGCPKKDPPPPPPPKPCPGCSPIPPEKRRPKPKFPPPDDELFAWVQPAFRGCGLA